MGEPCSSRHSLWSKVMGMRDKPRFGPVPPALLRRVLDGSSVRPDALARGRSVAARPGDRSREVAAALVDCLVDRRLP